jgi:hypothetical protein
MPTPPALRIVLGAANGRSVIRRHVKYRQDLGHFHADPDGDHVRRLSSLVKSVDFFLNGFQSVLLLHKWYGV